MLRPYLGQLGGSFDVKLLRSGLRRLAGHAGQLRMQRDHLHLRSGQNLAISSFLAILAQLLSQNLAVSPYFGPILTSNSRAQSDHLHLRSGDERAVQFVFCVRRGLQSAAATAATADAEAVHVRLQLDLRAQERKLDRACLQYLGLR